MTATIHTLVPKEQRSEAAESVAAVFRDPAAHSPRVLRRNLSLLALEVTFADDLVIGRDLHGLPARIRGIATMAADLGLATLSDAARNAAGAMSDPAFAALWARVIRLTDAALNPARDLVAGSH